MSLLHGQVVWICGVVALFLWWWLRSRKLRKLARTYFGNRATIKKPLFDKRLRFTFYDGSVFKCGPRGRWDGLVPDDMCVPLTRFAAAMSGQSYSETEILAEANQLRDELATRNTPRPITEDDIREVFCEEVMTDFERVEAGKWKMKIRGKPVVIGEWQIDLKQFFVKGRKPWQSEDNEETFFEVMTLMDETWGEIPLFGLGVNAAGYTIRYAKAYGFLIDDNRYRPFGDIIARRYFGAGAKGPNFNWIKFAWHVRLPEGRAAWLLYECRELGIKRIDGENAVTEAALRLCADRSHEIVVRAKKKDIMEIAYVAQQIGVTIVPEIYPSLLMTVLRGHLFLWAWVILTVPLMGFDGVGASVFVGGVVFAIAGIVGDMSGYRRRKARERGKKLIENKFASSNRRASVSDLHRGGWA